MITECEEECCSPVGLPVEQGERKQQLRRALIGAHIGSLSAIRWNEKMPMRRDKKTPAARSQKAVRQTVDRKQDAPLRKADAAILKSQNQYWRQRSRIVRDIMA